MLPDVTLYKINQAKRHFLEKGRGQPVVSSTVHRNSVTMPNVDHFVAFIASPHFITYSGLERHLASEKHVIRDEDEPLDDILKRKWVSTFSTTSSAQEVPKSSLQPSAVLHQPSSCQNSMSGLCEGWALKKARKNT